MSTKWTLVYQPSQFSPHFQPTGDVYATWDQATDAYRTSTDERLVQAWSVYVVPADATECTNEATGRTLRIAPTAAQKAAANARKTAIAKLLLAGTRDDLAERILRGWGNRVGAATLEEAAAAATDHGMTWSDVCFTQS